MDRDQLIYVIKKLASPVRPVERLMLMAQLRAHMGRGRRGVLRRALNWIPIVRRFHRLHESSSIKQACIGCKYSLAGLDSVWCDEVFVGPVVCPECGQDYPAISQ